FLNVSSMLTPHMIAEYIAITYMSLKAFSRELKKGNAELLILSLIEHRPRHGYEISKLIESRSGGALSFNVASFYPLLYRLEQRGLIQGRWVEKAGERRRRYYRLTAQGRATLKTQRSVWRDFVEAMNRITGAEHA
ncbi:MAG TPA: PadR family transcriptional regulator, partial [Acidobacteriota bacterium]|nr:PadR family transcriptional regulator [Acidobacteriota bacterium]